MSHDPSRHQEVGSPHDRIPGRLASAVTVVEQVFHLRVVYRDRRDGELPLLFEFLEALNPGRRLFADADKLRCRLWAVFVEPDHNVPPILDDERGREAQQAVDLLFMLL